MAAIEGLGRREEQNPAEAQARVRGLIQELEAAKGIPKPARAPQVNGKWRLRYTLSDGTASPIQRTFVGSSAVTVYQLINLDDPAEAPTVINKVDFGRCVRACRAYHAHTRRQAAPHCTAAPHHKPPIHHCLIGSAT